MFRYTCIVTTSILHRQLAEIGMPISHALVSTTTRVARERRTCTTNVKK